MFVSKNTMNPYQFMHQHKILDGLERISEAIPRNVNIYKRGLDGVNKTMETIQVLVLENLSRPSKYSNWYWNWCGLEAFQDPLMFSRSE